MGNNLWLRRFWFFHIHCAPAGGGDQFSTEGSARTSGFAGFSLIESAICADLLGLVLRVFGCVHLGGIFFVAERHCGWIRFLELDRWRRWGLTESAGAKQGGCSDGYNEFGEEAAACVHGELKCEISYVVFLSDHSEKMHVQTFDLFRISHLFWTRWACAI